MFRGAEVEGWSRTDVEMLESPELERKKYHQSRINQTYSSSTEMAQNVSTNNVNTYLYYRTNSN